MFNLVAPDIIQYLNGEYGLKIRKHVVKQMNEAYSKMLEKSNFKGKVSVIAHSLGTIITHNILTEQSNLQEE